LIPSIDIKNCAVINSKSITLVVTVLMQGMQGLNSKFLYNRLPAWLQGTYEAVRQLGKELCNIQVQRTCKILANDAPTLLSISGPVHQSTKCVKLQLTFNVSESQIQLLLKDKITNI
jgi:hypothetical protein